MDEVRPDLSLKNFVEAIQKPAAMLELEALFTAASFTSKLSSAVVETQAQHHRAVAAYRSNQAPGLQVKQLPWDLTDLQ